MQPPLKRPAAVRRKQPLNRREVRRRNSVERIKSEKQPFDLIDEIPSLSQRSYEEIPEDDILRMQWWGLYHNKPKVGRFMMRVKIPSGIISPGRLKVLGSISQRFGEDSGEITTRQDIQIHNVRLAQVPEIFDLLDGAGLSTAGACGDVLRNITGCPVSGLDSRELFDARPLIEVLSRRFSGRREFSNLPRKHKWTVSACPFQCNAPEIHDVALIGTRQQAREGFAVTVGGGLSTVPRIGRSLGVFLTPEEAPDFLGAVLKVWSSDLNYRRSRVKARFKFMVEDHGAQEVLRRVESTLGYSLTRLEELPKPSGRTDHMGVHPQRQEGLSYIGFPVFAGLLSGRQMEAVADIASAWCDDVRFTREQNLILSGVASSQVRRVVNLMVGAGLPLNVSGLRGGSIACTGNPHCNFAVGDTKPRLLELVRHLEERFGEAASELRVYLDGCPHACGQHWVGDIGIQGTTLRSGGEKHQAYDIFLRGGLGAQAHIGRPVARRVPTQALNGCLENLVADYLMTRTPEATFQEYCRSRSDEELLTIMQPPGAAAQS